MYVVGVFGLVLLALLAWIAVRLRDARREMAAARGALTEHVTLVGQALAAQLAHDREELRRHIDAAATVTVAQLQRAGPSPTPESVSGPTRSDATSTGRPRRIR